MTVPGQRGDGGQQPMTAADAAVLDARRQILLPVDRAAAAGRSGHRESRPMESGTAMVCVRASRIGSRQGNDRSRVDQCPRVDSDGSPWSSPGSKARPGGLTGRWWERDIADPTGTGTGRIAVTGLRRGGVVAMRVPWALAVDAAGRRAPGRSRSGSSEEDLRRFVGLPLHVRRDEAIRGRGTGGPNHGIGRHGQARSGHAERQAMDRGTR